jgi:branched-chain amino acid transport system substrate-binding protein
MPRNRNTINRRVFLSGASAAVVGAGSISRAYSQMAPLKIGVIHPTSGFMANIGQICNRGVEVAPAILKDLGYPAIELMYGDTESNPDVARAAGERLIDAGAQLLIGAFDSGQTSTLAQAAEQRGIPLVINTAGAPQITEQGYKFVFRIFPRAPDIVNGSFAVQKLVFAAAGKSPTKAVVLHRNDTYGTAVKGGLQALAPKADLPYQIVEFIGYDPQARDLSVEVAKAKATGADLMIEVSVANDAVLMTREMVKQRWEPMGIVAPGPGWYDLAYRKAMGKLGDYVISTVPWYDPKKKLTPIVLAAVTKKYPGEAVDSSTTYAFEAALVAADAYKRAGSAAPQALAEALRKTKIASADTINLSTGDGLFFDAKGQVNGIPMGGLQNLGGEPKVVVPASSAEAKLVFPMPGWQARG